MVAAVVPKLTAPVAATPAKPVPVMVTEVFPVAGPDTVLRDVTLGAPMIQVSPRVPEL